MLNRINIGTKLSLYWKCQLIGWGVVSLLWLYLALFRDDFKVTHALINYILDIIICIGLTHAYRTIALKSGWNHLKIKNLIVKAALSIVFLSILFMFLMNLKMSAYVYLINGRNIFIENMTVWNPVFITGLRHMAIWILAYHLYHIYLKEVHTAEKNAQLSVIAKQAQLDNLSSQLNPHFLFNSLNSIKSLIIENPKKARRAVDLLSDLLRSSLYEKKHTSITVGKELLLVQDYIELEQLRFEERLFVNFDINERLKDCKVPLLSIQLLVENAIKHGIDKQIEGGTIYISIQEKEQFVVITVQNPGDFNDLNSQGLGLKNLRKRLLLNYNRDATFHIESLPNNLVHATLTIPINKK